ncbi:MAG: hypothetical protein HYT89_00130 [Candidatus Omnitrophica bacterium]|nr:hypothetical protein [Candidatus Omnitrophota bacterium]
MSKYLWVVLFSFAMLTVAYAEETTDQTQTPSVSPAAETAVESQPAELSPEPAVVSEAPSEPVPAAIPADLAAPAESVTAEASDPAAAVQSPEPTGAPSEAATENLEFVSGEVGSIDESAKTVTIKLYGDTEDAAEKTVTVHLDDATDITDGEKDRELKSLAPGTEVDVEYDPASSKATYIFVY